MRHVNLLPADAYAGDRWFSPEKGGVETTKRILALASAATGLVLVLLGGLYIHERSIVNDRQETLTALEQKVATVEARAAKARAEQASVQAHLAAVVTVASQRMPWEKSLRELAQVLPDNASLTSLQVQAPSAVVAGAPPGSASGFSVTGVTTSQRAVALVLDRLALLPWLTDVTLQTSARGGGETGSVQFTIGAGVRSTGGR
jgi:Tfp pilus assembly protein PilN